MGIFFNKKNVINKIDRDDELLSCDDCHHHHQTKR